MTQYQPDTGRYDNATEGWFRRCGRSGLMLPAISLGCWHNFGAPGSDTGRHADEASFHANCQQMLFTAFDHGITHFDLANNYGPPPGAAEERVGRILREDFAGYRDELIISSKAGYRMWDGPYGEWGSRKSLLASLDQSLQRLGLDYVDIFYSHRPDPADGTPLEETMEALDTAVRQGKALYTGISSYPTERTELTMQVCRHERLAKPVIHQPCYSMFVRDLESSGLLSTCGVEGVGVIAFCPLAQGLLTNKYLNGVPEESRAASDSVFFTDERVTEEVVAKVRALNAIAQDRGQSLAQMALSWTLRDERVTSALIGASRPEQITENVAAAERTAFAKDELDAIEQALS